MGTFTCVADTPLLVRTMGNILNSETLLLVDIGSSTPSDFSASQEFGGDFESQSKVSVRLIACRGRLSERMSAIPSGGILQSISSAARATCITPCIRLQAYVIEGQLSLPTSKVADIVLVEVKDDRPADVFSKLLVKCFQVGINGRIGKYHFPEDNDSVSGIRASGNASRVPLTSSHLTTIYHPSYPPGNRRSRGRYRLQSTATWVGSSLRGQGLSGRWTRTRG